MKELGVYIVTFDRPGYGESDPHPKRSVRSAALDIEQLADQLDLGPKFYVMSFSLGGHAIWGSLKYIPHRFSSFFFPTLHLLSMILVDIILNRVHTENFAVSVTIVKKHNGCVRSFSKKFWDSAL